ncbi:MAG: hypothetical protein HQL84_04760 [Magnetococcales bacterium]|nr:hypothetical protein [Magnetococcales bacterium]MBF0149340.1 hypothetical protein [Magnetococcales bacterium]MBF0173353.1 hypothetical protein [Magnetococcales bacterium]MBF0632054.1 hypothetical protein [Magnetococcales bacterium]
MSQGSERKGGPGTRQQGAALLLLLSVVLIGGISMALEGLKIKSKRMRNDTSSAALLARAKKALIGSAVVNAGAAGQFGRLPCPANVTLGGYRTNAAASGPCGGADGQMAIGFLPWFDLGLPPFTDGSNAPIWYVVSGIFKSGSATANGYACDGNNLTLNGSGDYAAILIAPGDPLTFSPTRQVRDPTQTPTNLRDHFFEEENVTATTNFVIKTIQEDPSRIAISPLFNDRLLGIRCSEIMGVISRYASP